MDRQKYQIIFATGNQGKVREIREIIGSLQDQKNQGQGLEESAGKGMQDMADCPAGSQGQGPGAGPAQGPDAAPCKKEIEVLTMREADAFCEPEEDGADFEDNALIKARAVYQKLLSRPAPEGTVRIVMSDDSGLVIDALGGAPGVHSARYMGYDTDYRLRMEHILDLLKDVPDRDRTARFVAAVAAILPDGSEKTVRGAMEGRIGHKIAGGNGFGYDPFFFLPRYGKTSAEITPEEKNRISHRGQALRRMLQELGIAGGDDF